MNLRPLLDRLADEGLGTVGLTLFIQHIPEKVAEGIVLMLPASGVMIDHELPQYRSTGFQLVVRDKNYEDGNAMAQAASSALTLGETTLDGMLVKFCRPRHEPLPFQRSQGGYWEFSVNFDFTYLDNTVAA
jgi:hypothetical protein